MIISAKRQRHYWVSMSTLGDDELCSILAHLSDQSDRISFSQVCKQWLRVEGLTRLSIRVLEPHLLPNFLSRFPNLLSFQSSEPISDTQLEFVSRTCPNLQILNISLKQTRENFDESDDFNGFNDVGDKGICAIASGCRELMKVVLRRRWNVGDFGIVSLVNSAINLTNLDLGRCSLVTDQALESIGAARSICVLNLQGCVLITDWGLSFLANGSSSRALKKLVLAECDRITDFGVSMLKKMTSLEELNLAECGPKVTDIGGVEITSIRGLRRLNFSWLINVSDVTIVAIAKNCVNLVAIDLTGCELITGSGICAFANHKCLEALTLVSCYNVCGNDVEYAVLKCKSLGEVVLDKRMKMWMSTTVLDYIRTFCQLHWR